MSPGGTKHAPEAFNALERSFRCCSGFVGFSFPSTGLGLRDSWQAWCLLFVLTSLEGALSKKNSFCSLFIKEKKNHPWQMVHDSPHFLHSPQRTWLQLPIHCTGFQHKGHRIPAPVRRRKLRRIECFFFFSRKPRENNQFRVSRGAARWTAARFPPCLSLTGPLVVSKE